MSEILANMSLIQRLSQYLIKSRNSNYLEESIEYMVDLSKFQIQNIQHIVTNSGCRLKSTLITHKSINKNQINNSRCIIFLHGLGSNRTQSLYITRYLPHQYCLFVFDFQGFGKSNGQFVTYGLKESQDINKIIEFLREKKNINQFVIWGRSMGAVAGLLYSINLAEEAKGSLSAKQIQSKIKGLVLDSPFSDFRQITKQISIKKLNIPEFLVQFVLKSVETKLKVFFQEAKSKNYNPFNIKLGDQSIQTKIPTIFLYCEVDQVVPKEHSQKIIKVYRSPFQKIQIKNCSHNQFRGQQVIKQVFEYLKKFQSKYHRMKSIQTDGNDLSKNSSIKKGINVQSKQKQRQIRQNSLKNLHKDAIFLSNGNNNHQKIRIHQKQIDNKYSCKRQNSNFSLNNSFQRAKSIKNLISDKEFQLIEPQNYKRCKISMKKLQKNIKKNHEKQIQDDKSIEHFYNQKSIELENKKYLRNPPLAKNIYKQLTNEVYCHSYPVFYTS